MLSRDRWWALLSADAGKQKKTKLKAEKTKKNCQFCVSVCVNAVQLFNPVKTRLVIIVG